MDSQKISDWLQITGLFGVIGSLLFVGLQMRQTQEIALSAAYQARSDSSLAVRMAPLESEHLLSALTKMRLGQADELTPLELTAKIAWYDSELVYVENVHYQFINGFVSDEQWQTNFEELKFIFSDPHMRQRLDVQREVMRKTYFAEIQRAVEELDAEN